MKEDTNRVKVLNNLSWEYRKSNSEKALGYANKALPLAEKFNWEKGKATCFSRIGLINYWQNKLDIANEYYSMSLKINKKINNKSGIAENYIHFSYIYEDKGNYAKALEYNDEALKIYQELNEKNEIASCLVSSGNLNLYQQNYPSALENYLNSLTIFEEQKNVHGLAISYNNIGLIYRYQSNYEKALEYFFKGLKTKEEGKITQGISDSYTNIGAIYVNEKKYDLGLEYFFKALELDTKNNLKKNMAKLYGNIAVVYRNQEKYELALEYNIKALKLKEELNDKNSLVSSYNNIAAYYFSQQQYEQTIEYHQKGLKLAKELNDKKGMQNSYEGFINVYDKQNNHQKALEYYKLYSQIKDSIYSLATNQQLSEMQTKYETEKKEKEIRVLIQETEIQGLRLGTQQSELAKQQLEAETKEKEIILLNKNREIQQMVVDKQESELNYQIMETKNKTTEVALLSKDNKIQQTELSRQKMLRNSIGASLGLMLVLAFVIYRGYLRKQQANQELELKNKKIETAHNIIEQNRDEIAQKNKDITDSINYAKKIQQAMLPPLDLINQALPDSFVLFKPKDIVSGDFYWFSPFFTQNLGSIDANQPFSESGVIFAACDCTGHGVPGAFMSMIGNAQLNHIIVEKGIYNPAQALTHLNRNIKNSLKQSSDGVKSRDGMDIALTSLQWNNNQPKPDTKSEFTNQKQLNSTIKLQFSGAYRPIWIIKNGSTDIQSSFIHNKDESSSPNTFSKNPSSQIIEIQGDKTSIGGFTEDEYKFTNHEIELQKGDCFYIFTDGYVDQFGGEKNKKYKSSRLKELLLSICHLPMEEQKSILDSTIENWKGHFEQIDDICMIGVRV
ncbi:MAG TPA: tetratricopeptide repeat protein [Bacteroidia bacterium]|nr:tetratricopeptide repeat protein [Bacteroidia bacterium]